MSLQSIRSACALILVLGLSAAVFAEDPAGPIRVGIIGLDAHAVPWTKIIADPNSPAPIHELKIVVATPAFSPDIPFQRGQHRE